MSIPLAEFTAHFRCLDNLPEEPWAQLFLAHGAGAGWRHPWLEHMASLLQMQGIWVRRIEFPYAQWMREFSRRRPPQPVPQLVAYFDQLLAKQRAPQLPCFVAGKSLGGRVAAMLEHTSVVGALAYGYPFHPVKKPANLRLEPLLQGQIPMLVVQGERDPFGTRAEVASYSLPPWVQLEWLLDGDHDWRPRVASGTTQQAHWQQAARVSAAFMRAQLGHSAGRA